MRIFRLSAPSLMVVGFLVLAALPRTTAARAAPAPQTTPPPNRYVFLPVVIRPRYVDVVVAMTGPDPLLGPGADLAYSIAISNTGPDDVADLRAVDTFPQTAGVMNWICSASGGAGCGQGAGSGPLDIQLNLPLSGSVLITATGRISLSATGIFTNEVSLKLPAGLADSRPENNRARLTTTLVTPPAESAGWLAYLNYLRALARLPGLSENTEWSTGAFLHSRYIVRNDPDPLSFHDENSQSPEWTPEGTLAAKNGIVVAAGSPNFSDQEAINIWAAEPFQMVGVIDPQLTRTGFGSFREAGDTWQTAAVLDVVRGLITDSLPAGVSFPIMWPAAGMAVNLTSFNGYDTLSPLTHGTCNSFGVPAGLPILLMLGDGSQTPVVTASSLTRSDGLPNDHCVFSEANYANPDSSRQTLGREVLGQRDAILLLPKKPLTPGGQYTVSITAGGQTYTWTFQVLLSASPSLASAGFSQAISR